MPRSFIIICSVWALKGSHFRAVGQIEADPLLSWPRRTSSPQTRREAKQGEISLLGLWHQCLQESNHPGYSSPLWM
jgi:hypothetical protein